MGRELLETVKGRLEFELIFEKFLADTIRIRASIEREEELMNNNLSGHGPLWPRQPPHCVARPAGRRSTPLTPSRSTGALIAPSWCWTTWPTPTNAAGTVWPAARAVGGSFRNCTVQYKTELIE